MTQFEFDKLLEKYLAGGCDPAEERLIEAWTERQVTNATPFPLTQSETTTVQKRLKKRIDKETVGVWRLPSPFSVYRLGIAACLLGLIGLTAWFLTQNSKLKTFTEGSFGHDKTASFELSNTTNAAQAFKLKDGSTITLKPQSQLTYLENFGIENRIVFLKGEGYFEIAHDTSKPFYVYAGNLVTKVLGTKFTVKVYESGKKTEVVVTSGKVMVYENVGGKVSKSAILTPNQTIAYVPNTAIFKPQIIDNPIIIRPIERKEDFVFDGIPLSKVLNRLKNVYAIDILTKNDALQNCLFTGDLNGLTLNEQLELICKATDTHAQKYETAIWLDGDGCN